MIKPKAKGTAKVGAGAKAKGAASVKKLTIAKRVSPAATGRMSKAKNEQGEANKNIVNKLQTQMYVNSAMGEGTYERAKKGPAGTRASVPSPHYWGGSKRKPSKAESSANSAYGGYKRLATRGK